MSLHFILVYLRITYICYTYIQLTRLEFVSMIFFFFYAV